MKFIYKKSYDEDLINIYSAEDLARLIKDNIEYYEDIAKFSQEKANKTREEVVIEIRNDFEEKNQHLKDKLRFSYGNFNSEKELEAWEQFKKEHSDCWKNSKIGATRGFYIKPYYTGFGNGFYACCQNCNIEKDITDKDNWINI